MSTIDASQCWRIMPFSMFDGEDDEWWVLGPDHQPVNGGIVPTKEQAFAMALEHNKAYGVDAVYVYTTSSTRKGNWEKPPEETEPQVTTDEIWEQMDKDYEEYKRLAAGEYPEAARVERDVRESKARNPHMPEEMLRKLAVAAIAAKKHLHEAGFIGIGAYDYLFDPEEMGDLEYTPEEAKLLQQTWHIMPLLRDEEEGKCWWVLGPNNSGIENDTSRAGPFTTKAEAFAMALEHNQSLGISVVYVHGEHDDEGERADGDFEGPAVDAGKQKLKSMQAIREVGDYAVKKVLADLRSEEQPKQSRKPRCES